MLRALLRPLAAAALLATPAFAHDGCGFPFPRFAPFPFFRGAPRIEIEFGRARPVHHHRYTIVRERVWVEPVYDTRVVGYDLCGRPICHRILVSGGYWTTVETRQCACGDRIRG